MRRITGLIRREPYRLFFPLGVLFSLAGTGHWVVYGTGLSETVSSTFHSLVQIWLFMSSFVCGFLMTAIPRFASAPHATAAEVAGVAVALAAVLAFLTAGLWTAAGAAYLAWVFAVLTFIGRRFLKKSRSVSPPLEFIWIPVAFLHAACGTALFTLGQADVVSPGYTLIGRSMSYQGFLLSLVLGIGGFLGPRIMGTFEPALGSDPRALTASRRRRLILGLATATLLFASFWIESASAPLGWYTRASAVFLQALFSGVLATPKIRGLFQHLVSLSFRLIMAGTAATAFFPSHRVAALHVLFIGGFSLLTYLVATMVVLSHSGEGEALSRPLRIFWIVAGGLLSALAVRLAAHVLPEHFFLFLSVSSGLWILTSLAWLVFAGPRLWRSPEGSRFEDQHEKFKEGLKLRHAC